MVNTIYPESLTQIYDLLKVRRGCGARLAARRRRLTPPILALPPQDDYVIVYQRPTQGLFKSENDGFQESVDDITTLEAHAAKVGGSACSVRRRRRVSAR